MPENTLWEVANLALIVMGFSGFVAFMGRRADGEWTQGDLKRLIFMIIMGTRLLFAALLPMVFIHFGMIEQVVWAISSGILAIVGTVYATIMVLKLNKVAADEHSSKTVDRLVRILIPLSILISALNAFGIVFDQSFGAYFLVLMLDLVLCLIYLTRLFHTGLFPLVKE